ncbi:hypothetical protein BC829DRAFT_415334 [Chytridium lagenaria]|nr:hypothetical protein BC829DRAFT_415334 [Chytridium lagenaria]
MSNTWTTPGYGFIAGYGGENVAPGISDDRCTSTVRDGVGCVSNDYASAMEICNSHSDCGGFICWDQSTSANALKGCYPLLTPMRLEGASVVINNAQSIPISYSDSSLPSPPPPPPPAPSVSPVSNPISPPSQPDQNNMRFTTTSSSIFTAQTTAALAVPQVTFSINPGETDKSNGSSIQTATVSTSGTIPSSFPSIIAVGVGSFVAAFVVMGVIAFIIFIRRRKTRKVTHTDPYPTKSTRRSISSTNESVSQSFYSDSSYQAPGPAARALPNRFSMAPPYMPPDDELSSQNSAASADVKTSGALFHSRQSLSSSQEYSLLAGVKDSTSLFHLSQPLSPSPAPFASGKSRYTNDENVEELHPQTWNTRQTVNWLHGKRIAPHIIIIFETNRICGNELWDMDAYRASLLGLHTSSADVMKFLEEVRILRTRFTLAGPSLPVYQN